MQKKHFDSYDAAESFVFEKHKEGKFIFDIQADPDDESKFVVSWVEQKVYIAQDGKEYTDEVWVTKDGELKNIQDLTEDHAKNIIRMLIRQEREYATMLQDAMKKLGSRLLETYAQDDIDQMEIVPSKKPTLH